VLNIPIYQGQLTLTTTGTSGAATLVGTTLNIPQYSGGGGTPAGSAGQVQFNSTPAGSFAASSNLAWNNVAVQLNIGAPFSPTGKLNVKGGGTLTTVNTRLTNSGDTELLKVLDNGNTNIGTAFNWDNANSRLGIGVTSPTQPLSVLGAIRSQVTGAACSFTANNPGAGYPRAVFLIGNSTSDVNVGLQVSPIFEPKPVSFDICNYNNIGDANSKFINLYVTSTINHITSTSNAGNNSGNALHIGTNTIGSTQGIVIGTVATGQNVGIGNTALSARLHVRGANATAGVGALLVQDGAVTPADIYRIDNDGKVTYRANAISGTTGNQTINAPSGNVNFAAGATALTVTNSLCTTSSLVFATVRTNDATAYIKNVVPAANSFTINLGAAATAVTSVGFFIIN
jgi:hypothetical protein